IYFVDDGTVGGAGTGGLYVATWNSAIDQNPWNTAAFDPITAASWSANVATITANNDFAVGQTVTVTGVSSSGAGNFNRTSTIPAATPTSFSYALATDPGTTTSVSGPTASLPSNNAAAVAAGVVNHWTVPVRLGDAPAQTGSGGVGQLRGLAGTVISPT